MAKITITRALSELKSLKSKHSKLTDELNILAVQVGTKLCGGDISYKPEDFIKRAKESFQSVTDVYKRIVTIKTEIDKSNSVTEVVIGSEKMTVQEAIVRKNLIDCERRLLRAMKQEKVATDSLVEQKQMEIEQSVMQLRNTYATAGKDKDIETVVEALMKTSEVKLIDPCEVTKVIKEYEERLDDFLTNVDYALSESNSTTFIEVPD